jgi:flagellar basal body-associated protein FliL
MGATDDANEEATAAPAPAKGKAIPIFLGLNTLLLAGVMVFVLKRPATASAPVAESAHGAEGTAHAAELMPGPTLKLESFIIQLKAVESDRYVRVAFDLELGSEADKAIVTARMSPVRDSVISFFSDRSLDELRGSVGMERTKAELLKRLAAIVPEGHIKALYITDFVVQ